MQYSGIDLWNESNIKSFASPCLLFKALSQCTKSFELFLSYKLGEPALALLASEKTYNGTLFQFIISSYPCPLLSLKATIDMIQHPKGRKLN
jgi:hypothetical protein